MMTGYTYAMMFVVVIDRIKFSFNMVCKEWVSNKASAENK